MLVQDPALARGGTFHGAGNFASPSEVIRGGYDDIFGNREIAQREPNLDLPLVFRSLQRHDDEKIHIAIRPGHASGMGAE